MTQRRRWIFLMLLVVAIGGPALWPSISSAPAARAAAQAPPRRALPPPVPRPRRPLPSNAVRDWGKTYYELESTASSVVAEFEETVVTARRDGAHNVSSEVTERGRSRVLARGTVAGGATALSFRLAGVAGQGDTVPVRQGRSTLDWASIQTYLLSREGRSIDRREELRDGYLRRSATRDNPDDLPVRLTTHFGNGLVATTTRRGSSLDPEAETGMPYFSTVLTRDDEGVGTLQWHPGRRQMTWHFPGLTQGKITEESLQRVGKEWEFTPTLAWANVQALAFYEMYTKLKQEQIAFAGRAGGGCVPGSTQRQPAKVVASLFNAMYPIALADAPGCDGLNWLDNTIVRPCCDQHDKCYAKEGCTAWSWLWPFSGSWACETCNIEAAMCVVGMFECQTDPACVCAMEGGWWDIWEGCMVEPIVINVGNRAKFFLSSPENGVLFDIHGKGVKTKVSWTLADQEVGFLVLDRNGNGRIDDGTEWFGNNTPLQNGQNAAHGLDALRDLDGGDATDGAVTPSDEAYGRLRVWFDRNRNGISERSELETLSDLSITSLSTKYEKTDWVDRNGNIYIYGADFTIGKGRRTTTRKMYDALLQRGE